MNYKVSFVYPAMVIEAGSPEQAREAFVEYWAEWADLFDPCSVVETDELAELRVETGEYDVLP